MSEISSSSSSPICYSPVVPGLGMVFHREARRDSPLVLRVTVQHVTDAVETALHSLEQHGWRPRRQDDFLTDSELPRSVDYQHETLPPGIWVSAQRKEVQEDMQGFFEAFGFWKVPVITVSRLFD